MLIDTHCHLTDERFADIKEVLRRAALSEVEAVVIPSTNLADAKRAEILAVQENQYSLAGIHPEEVSEVLDIDREIDELKKIITESRRVVGIGEIGLDYYWDKEKKTEKKQVELFRRQMKLAVALKIPAAIHMRGAEKEMIKELRSLKSVPEGQFHCFSGSPDFLEIVLKMGFYVSFCGNITYKSASNLRELLKKVPVNRLLLETDSPYLPPEPLRGTVNSPENVKITAEFIAAELEIDFEELAQITTNNAKCLYSLDI